MKNNSKENHRLRALFPTELDTEYAIAEGQFDMVKRRIKPCDIWENPCYAQRAKAFVALESDRVGRGALIATRGLNEYEILRDGKNTAAITLLRSVGEIGDWGVFPTPSGQKIGEYTLEYSFLPYQTEQRGAAYALGYSFAYPSAIAVGAEAKEGGLPSEYKLISFDNPYARMTALKERSLGRESY